jgi:hypothetical protein
MSGDGDDAADTGPDAIPAVPETEEMPPDWRPGQDLLYTFHDGEATVIVEDESAESGGGRPPKEQRPDVKYETLDTRLEDAHFAQQIEDATERYHESAGDYLAGAGLGANPDLAKATEALNHAINQLLQRWNADRR